MRTNAALALTLAGVSMLAGCGSKSEPSCEAATQRFAQRHADLLDQRGKPASSASAGGSAGNLFTVMAGVCQERRWPKEVIRCVGEATTAAHYRACEAMLPEAQRTNLADRIGLVEMARLGIETTKEEQARGTVWTLATKSYPVWRQAHPGEPCPAQIEVLFEGFEGMSAVDPWGKPYRMSCGAEKPPEALGVAIWSDGPDGATGTDDDVRSW
jgi:hypothetical protein